MNKELDAAYEASLEVFRAASRAFSKAQTAYRARQIGDAEYLNARAAFRAAQDMADTAETAYINAINAQS